MALWDFSQNRPFWGYGFRPLKSRSRNPVFWLHCWENRTLPSAFRNFLKVRRSVSAGFSASFVGFFAKVGVSDGKSGRFPENSVLRILNILLIFGPERTSQTDYKAGKERKKAFFNGILGRFCGIFGKNRVFGGTAVFSVKCCSRSPIFTHFSVRKGVFRLIFKAGRTTAFVGFGNDFVGFSAKNGFLGVRKQGSSEKTEVIL